MAEGRKKKPLNSGFLFILRYKYVCDFSQLESNQ